STPVSWKPLIVTRAGRSAADDAASPAAEGVGGVATAGTSTMAGIGPTMAGMGPAVGPAAALAVVEPVALVAGAARAPTSVVAGSAPVAGAISGMGNVAGPRCRIAAPITPGSAP